MAKWQIKHHLLFSVSSFKNPFLSRLQFFILPQSQFPDPSSTFHFPRAKAHRPSPMRLRTAPFGGMPTTVCDVIRLSAARRLRFAARPLKLRPAPLWRDWQARDVCTVYSSAFVICGGFPVLYILYTLHMITILSCIMYRAMEKQTLKLRRSVIGVL